MLIGSLALTVLMVIILFGVPIGVAMALVGLVGVFIYTGSFEAATSVVGSTFFSESSTAAYIAIPMFIVMGTLAFNAGISGELFTLAYRTMGRVQGGLAIAVCWASAAFGAITGSSTATTVAMGRLSLPEMDRFKYSRKLSLGVIASAGTLAAMIPPSVMLIIYAMFTEQSVGRMLIAGLVPGLLSAAVFSISIYIRCRLHPELGPKGPSFPIRDIARSSILVLPFLGIMIAIIGGILFGVWSPTEAASVGVVLVAGYALARKKLKRAATEEAFREAILVTGRVFILVIGSLALGRFLTVCGFTSETTQTVIGWGLQSWALFVVLCLFYMLLGTFLEGISMLAITIPFVMPVVTAQGWDLIWFGVVFVKLVEIAALSPPVGLNLSALKSVVPSTSIGEIAWSSLYFWGLDCLILAILFVFPGIVMWLPDKVIL